MAQSKPKKNADTEVEPLVEKIHLTDLGNAGRLVDSFGDDLRRCSVYPGDGWLTWDGRRWEIDDTLQVMRYAAKVPKVIEREGREASNEETRLRADGETEKADKSKRVADAVGVWAKKSESRSAQKAMVSLAMADRRVVVRENELDRDPWVLCTPSGVVDLRTGKTREHRRNDLITRITKVPIADPGADCPTWKAALFEILGGREDIYYWMQRSIGYSLCGDRREQIVIIMHGSGRNGKGTFLNTFHSILGDYARVTPAQTFLSHREGGIPNDLAALSGVRFVTAQETEDGKSLDEATIKTVSGGDPISARFLNREWFTYTPCFQLWFSTNHRPIIRGMDNGIWSRLRLVPFTVSFAGREDRTLGARIMAEAPAILRWAVDGCLAWQEQGLTPPDDVRAATEEYRSEMDVLADFIGECCDLGSIYTVENGDLYQAFSQWLVKRGERPRSHRWLTRALKDRCYTQSRTGARFWEGIGLKRGVQVNRQSTWTPQAEA